MDDDGLNGEPLTLPQPVAPGEEPYRYILFEDIAETFFPSNLTPGTLCWVLLSKGRGRTTRDDDTISQRAAAELFNRARVVEDDDDESDFERRILVRYPKGSTYHVKRCNLVPVLERIPQRLVIIYPETPEYRKGCIVHTCINDTFLEIGCDFGPTTDKVQKALLEVRGVPQDPEEGPISPTLSDGKVLCLGIDKSPSSIEIAVNRYPDCTFSIEDALTEAGVEKLRELCRTKLEKGYPSTVAIDINGNRMIPAVLQCIENVMKPASIEDTNWKLPSRIFVKSRHLHIKLKKLVSEEEQRATDTIIEVDL